MNHRFLPWAVCILALSQLALHHAQCEVLHLWGPKETPVDSRFGFSVSLQVDHMAVGKPYDGAPIATGAVELFLRHKDGLAWSSLGTLIASNGEKYDQFGYSVCIDEERLLVGAPAHGLLGAKGLAYIFERQLDGAWIETDQLSPPEKAWAFGWSVDLEGDRIAVGAKGASSLGGGNGLVCIFERQESGWVLMSTVKPTISTAGDGFGASLDLEGERLVVGAPYAWTSSTPYEGLAFVFERVPPGWIWSQKAVLSPDDLKDNDQFGRGVALDGDRVVVGAPFHDLPTPFVGAAYVFDRVDGAWSQAAKLTPADLPLLADFGWSVEVDGSRVLVGAPSDKDLAATAGAIYVFDETAGSWSMSAKFHGTGLVAGDSFGSCLDLEGSELVAGAPFLWSAGGHPGQAYLFDLDASDPSLLADATSISLAAGGAQTFHLGACGVHAGDLYVVAGSATGTEPGFALGALDVPLNLDAYFRYLLKNPGAPPLQGSIGVLSAFGTATAAFAVPPGTDAALAGLTLHHAYAVLDAATLAIEAVSAAVPVALTP